MENEIKKYRQELMGIATIMILLGHTVFYGSEYVDFGYILHDIVTLGYSGVDIFLFLSGFGLTFSIAKNSKMDFYSHRIKRLLPSILGIWILYILVHVKQLSFLTIVAPLLQVYNGGYWYLGFIIIAYFCFPYLFAISKKEKGWFVIILSLFVSFTLLLPFICQGNAVSCNPKVCVVTRIPIFILGMVFAMGKIDWLNSVSINMLLLVVGLISLCPYYLHDNLGGNKHFTTYYNIYIITPSIIYIYSKVINVVGGVKILRDIGIFSLEIYLVQVTIMSSLMTKFHQLGINTGLNIIYSTVIVILIAVLMKYITERIFSNLIWSK